MSRAHAGLRHQFLYPVRHAVDSAHAVIYNVDLATASKLPLYCIRYQLVVLLHYVGLHGVAVLRRLLYNGHVAHAYQAHVQSPGDGCRGQGKHVHVLAELLYGFLVLHAEALLLVYHEQPKVLEFHVF